MLLTEKRSIMHRDVYRWNSHCKQPENVGKIKENRDLAIVKKEKIQKLSTSYPHFVDNLFLGDKRWKNMLICSKEANTRYRISFIL